MIEYKLVKFSDVYHELHKLMKEHWDELGHRGGFKELLLDIPKFLYLEERNMVAVTVAVKDNKIIGYGNFLIESINHNANKLSAYVDALYVDKNYRNSLAGVGYKLLTFSEKILRNEFNTSAMQFAVNINYDISGLLKKSGYVETETIYIKTIEGE